VISENRSVKQKRKVVVIGTVVVVASAVLTRVSMLCMQSAILCYQIPLSVRLSLRHTLVLYINECAYRVLWLCLCLFYAYFNVLLI